MANGVAPPTLLRQCTWGPEAALHPVPLRRTRSENCQPSNRPIDRRALRAALMRSRVNVQSSYELSKVMPTPAKANVFEVLAMRLFEELIPAAQVLENRRAMPAAEGANDRWLNESLPASPNEASAEGSLVRMEAELLKIQDLSQSELGTCDVPGLRERWRAVDSQLHTFKSDTLASRARKVFSQLCALSESLSHHLAALEGGEQASHAALLEESLQDQTAKTLVMSRKQREAVECASSVFLQGRSGTGKTLVLLRRILRHQSNGFAHRQLFVTKSSLLRDAVKADLAKVSDKVADRWLVGYGVACLTWEQLTKHIGYASSHNAVVDYQRFKDYYWPTLRSLAGQLPPLCVWAEFNTRLRPFKCQAGISVLTFEDYIRDDLAAVGVRLERADQHAVYKTFQKYAKMKENIGEADEVDVAMHLHQHLSQNHIVDAIYVDEAQDFSPVQITLLLRMCRNSDGVTLAGDTCQTINPGSAFNFADIIDAFRSIHESASADAGSMLTLPYNYRCSAGVCALGNSVSRLLLQRFPRCADRIDEETPIQEGNEPAVLVQLPGQVPGDCIMGRGNSFRVRHVDPANTVVLVRSGERRQALRNQGVRATILTVAESKGLEFDFAILCGLLSDNPNTASFTLAKETSAESQIAGLAMSAESFLYGEGSIGRLSSRAHMLLWSVILAIPEFKNLYVAITRARRGCVILECSTDIARFDPMLVHWRNQGVVDAWLGLAEYKLHIAPQAPGTPHAKSASTHLASLAHLHLSCAEMVRWIEIELSVREGREQKKARAALGRELFRLRNGGEVHQGFCDRFVIEYGRVDVMSSLVRPSSNRKGAGRREIAALRVPESMAESSGNSSCQELPSLVPMLERRFPRGSGTKDRDLIGEVKSRAFQLFAHATDDPQGRWPVFDEAARIFAHAISSAKMMLLSRLDSASFVGAGRSDPLAAGEVPESIAFHEMCSVFLEACRASSWRGGSRLCKLRRLAIWCNVFSFLAPSGSDIYNAVCLVAEMVQSHHALCHDLFRALLMAKGRYFLASACYDQEMRSQAEQLQNASESFLTVPAHDVTLLRWYEQRRHLQKSKQYLDDLLPLTMRRVRACVQAGHLFLALRRVDLAADAFSSAVGIGVNTLRLVWGLARNAKKAPDELVDAEQRVLRTRKNAAKAETEKLAKADKDDAKKAELAATVAERAEKDAKEAEEYAALVYEEVPRALEDSDLLFAMRAEIRGIALHAAQTNLLLVQSEKTLGNATAAKNAMQSAASYFLQAGCAPIALAGVSKLAGAGLTFLCTHWLNTAM